MSCFQEMKVNEEKFKKASKAEIIKEISLVDDEINNNMSQYLYRHQQLSNYKKQLEEELQRR